MESIMSQIEIRSATEDDAGLILKMIIELAIYEKLEDQVVASEKDIRESIFSEGSSTRALICTIDEVPVGYAVYFFNYSTWLGKNGLYLEDLYVSPEHRGYGAGKALLKHLAKVAVAKNCGRFEWNVLDWNEPAIKFYESLGAQAQSEWVGYRISGKALNDLAEN